MADKKTHLASLVIGAILVGANLVALNYLLAGWSTARLDLTSEGIYSISPATKRILANLDENLTIQGYFSSRTHPKLAPLVPEIEDLLEEYRAVSRGRVTIEISDPSTDEDAEEEAADRYGVRSMPFQLNTKYESAIVNAYFALVVKYGDQYVRYGVGDLIAVDATPDGDIDVRLRNLEYDLTRAVKKVVHGFRSSNELFERTEDPVKMTVIWTPKKLPELFAEIPDAVKKAADELQEAGGDKFIYEEIDPTGDEAAKQALYDRYGARPMSLGLFGGDEFYLYGILEAGGRLELIPLTGESVTAASIRESVENSLRRSMPGFLKTVGIYAPKPIEFPPELRMQMQMPPQPPPEFEEIKRQLAEEYEVLDVDLQAAGGVPSEVDILLVLQPQDFSEMQAYQLDQYLMRGGRIVLCTGNYDTEFGPGGLSVTPVESGLEAWLQHHGISVDPTLVLDDRNQKLPIPEMRSTPFGQVRSWRLAPYPYLVQVQADGFKSPEITSTLDAVGIYWGSPLTVDAEATGDKKVIPILQSSERSWTDDDVTAVTYVDYQVPEGRTEPYLLAAALSGRFKSFFAGKPVPGTDTGAAGDDEEPATPSSTVTLGESPETRLVVVGNAEFLNDFVARALGQVDGGFFLENLRFVQNVIDWVSLDNEMLSIRARGMASRRLDPVDKSTKRLVEIANVVLPLVLLAGLGAYLRVRRRQITALGPRTSRGVGVGSTSPGEA